VESNPTIKIAMSTVMVRGRPKCAAGGDWDVQEGTMHGNRIVDVSPVPPWPLAEAVEAADIGVQQALSSASPSCAGIGPDTHTETERMILVVTSF
jgi:hypothetical protein